MKFKKISEVQRCRMAIFHFYFHLLILALILVIIAAEDECEPSNCGPNPPVIRFPFRLKGRQPDHCGYPAGFQVSCNNHNETELDLQYPARASTNNIVIPISVKAVVLEIDYKSQTMRVSIVNASCFPREVPAVNSSSWASPFESNGQYSNPYPHYIFFNCSSGSEDSGSGYSIPCLSGPGYRVYAFDSSTEATRWPLSCVKMYNISDVPYSILSPPDYVANPGESLKWSTPFCKNCEDLGKYCRLEKNRKNVTECYDPTPDKDTSCSMKKGMIAGITVGVLLISGIVGYTLYRIISLKKRKHKDQEMKGKEISIHIEKEIDRKIVKKVTVVGLWCVQWNPADRPSMKVVIQMLEGENVPAMPPNPFDSPEPIAKAIVEGSLFDSEIQTSY
nr:rust resistance kinase Lr10-like [Ipomoea batatas]